MSERMFYMKKQWSTILIGALLLLVVIFAVMNVDPVSINFGFTLLSIPLVIVIIGTLLIGMIIAAIWSTTILLRDRREQKDLQNQLSDYETEAAKRRDELTQNHLKEKRKLEEQLEKVQTENRELKRRVQNMETNSSIKETKPKTE